MEAGIGIPGEPGRRREKIKPAEEIVEALIADVPFAEGDEIALMVNGLGGTPIGELYILFGNEHERLTSHGISVARSYVGEYCTALDMVGMSITLVKLDDEIERLLDAHAEVCARIF